MGSYNAELSAWFNQGTFPQNNAWTIEWQRLDEFLWNCKLAIRARCERDCCAGKMTTEVVNSMQTRARQLRLGLIAELQLEPYALPDIVVEGVGQWHTYETSLYWLVTQQYIKNMRNYVALFAADGWPELSDVWQAAIVVRALERNA